MTAFFYGFNPPLKDWAFINQLVHPATTAKVLNRRLILNKSIKKYQIINSLNDLNSRAITKQNSNSEKIIKVLSVSSIECFQKLSEIDNSYLIDVRTKPEWLFVGKPYLRVLNKQVHFVSWQKYPNMKINTKFYKQILNYKINKDDFIFLICRSGKRSLSAALNLTKFGFLNIYNVEDGFEGDTNSKNQRSSINGWKFNNLPWRQ